jgi:hypothetical protein
MNFIGRFKKASQFVSRDWGLVVDMKKFLQTWPEECGREWWGYHILVRWPIYDRNRICTVPSESFVIHPNDGWWQCPPQCPWHICRRHDKVPGYFLAREIKISSSARPTFVSLLILTFLTVLALMGHVAFVVISAVLYLSGYNILPLILDDMPAFNMHDIIYRRELVSRKWGGLRYTWKRTDT